MRLYNCLASSTNNFSTCSGKKINYANISVHLLKILFQSNIITSQCFKNNSTVHSIYADLTRTSEADPK